MNFIMSIRIKNRQQKYVFLAQLTVGIWGGRVERREERRQTPRHINPQMKKKKERKVDTEDLVWYRRSMHRSGT